MRMRDEHASAQNVDRGAPSTGLSGKGRDFSAGDPWSYPRSGPYQHPALPEDGIHLLPSLLLHTFARDGREGLRGWGVNLEGSLGAGLGPFVLGEADPESEEAFLGGGTGTLVLKSGEVLTASGHHFFALLALDQASGYALEDAVLVLPGRDADYPAGRPAGFASTSDPLLPEPLPRLLSDDARFRDLSIHPFAYAYYDVALWEQDPHVDPETGWSYDGGEKVMEALARKLSRRSEAR